MQSEKSQSAFNLPYNQSHYYWLAVFPLSDNTALQSDLIASGMQIVPALGNAFIMRLAHPWDAAWKAVREILAKHEAEQQVEIALIPAEAQPGFEEFSYARKSVAAINFLADSLWLGNAMIEDRVVSYMQPVLDKRGKVFGYEAFARVETDKEPIGGGKIIEASRGLSAEYILDRHLHVKAITSFIDSDLEGFLFINFVPGFIHRPEKYLEGLTEAAKYNGMPAKQIVLDFTQSEAPRDIMHMKAIFDYCRSKGYSLSLDDISSVAIAKKILETIRPDFIKLDINLVRGAQGIAEQKIIKELVHMAHASGVTILAEGVETEAVHRELLKVDVDLFQGYLFSPPVAVSTLKKAVG